MSTPERENVQSHYFCQNCGTTTEENVCSQCQSETVEQQIIPTTLTNDLVPSMVLSAGFEQVFRHDFDLESLASIVLPLLLSRTQSHRHRRVKFPRRIKRVTHSIQSHRHSTVLDFSQTPNGSAPTQFLNVNNFLPIRSWSSSGFNAGQMPIELLFMDINGEHSEIIHSLFMDETEPLPLTREQINGLTAVSMTASTLMLYSMCAICLETYDRTSAVKQLPTCHHVFHELCLTEWLLRHGNCPLCRTPIFPRLRIL